MLVNSVGWVKIHKFLLSIKKQLNDKINEK
jgi:hypothetical protein